MASSQDICNINIIALLPPLPQWPYSLSKSSFCNSWLVFHNNHLKTMVGFESFDLIYNIIIVLTNTALAMIHIQIIFCCLWLFSHHHQHHYISRHCFFSSSTFDYSASPEDTGWTQEHWSRCWCPSSVCNRTSSTSAGRTLPPEKERNQFTISILPKEEQDTAFVI